MQAVWTIRLVSRVSLVSRQPLYVASYFSRVIFLPRCNRIEDVEQQEPRGKAAKMRLPSHLLALPLPDRDRTQSEQRIQTDPDAEEHQKTRIAHRRQQR